MTRGIHTVLLTLGATMMLLPALVRATEPLVEPQRNPFDRPAAEVLVASAVSRNTDTTATNGPYLRAVLAAGSKSVVDFGGVILQIGESANGYRLLAVEEGQATFTRDDKKVVFFLYEQVGGDQK